MTREEAANLLDHYCYGNTNILRDCDDELAEKIQTAMDEAIAALRDAQARQEGCDTCLKGKAHFGDVLWAINRNGKAVININGEQANTVFHHCPMCGRKLEDEK